MAYKVYDATTAANAVSSKCSIQFVSKLNFQVKWTGTVNGTLNVQQSDIDDPDESFGSTDWKTMTPTFPNQPAGSPGSTDEDFYEAGARWIRVIFTFTSGTGNMKIYFQPKDIA